MNLKTLTLPLLLIAVVFIGLGDRILFQHPQRHQSSFDGSIAQTKASETECRNGKSSG
jgi:hypothetical protein